MPIPPWSTGYRRAIRYRIVENSRE
jgi:hypothetical protein